jgi:hypothetical protein
VPWIKAKWARNERPTIYCYSDAGPAGYRISDVRAACDAAGVRHPLFLIAKWDNDPSTFDPSGDREIIGKQYAGSAQTGGHYDASIVADDWMPTPPAAQPAPPYGTSYVTHAELDLYKATLEREIGERIRAAIAGTTLTPPA